MRGNGAFENLSSSSLRGEEKVQCPYCYNGHDVVPGENGEPISVGPCPFCYGEGEITKAQEEVYIKHQEREVMIDGEIPF